MRQTFKSPGSVKSLKIFFLVYTLFLGTGASSQADSIYTDLPANENDLKNVIHLDLSTWHSSEYNYQLPEMIRELKNLESIDYGEDLVVSFPEWITELEKLTTVAFNDLYLECSGKDLMADMGISNPISNPENPCYEKIKMVTDAYDPVLVGVLTADNSYQVINIVNEEILFTGIDRFLVTPCGEPLMIDGRTLIFKQDLYLDYENLTVADFYKYPFSSEISEVQLNRCEDELHEISLSNNENYYFSNRFLLLIKKGQKEIDYDDDYSQCRLYVDEISEDHYILKRVLEKYYFYAECTPEKMEKVITQVEKINAHGEYYTWDFMEQNLIGKKVEVLPVEKNEEKQLKCLEMIEEWSGNNPGEKNLSIEMMLELQDNGCFRVEIIE